MTKTSSERWSDLRWSVATNVLTTVIGAILSAAGVYLLGEVTGVNDRLFNDMSCADFETQAEAQAMYNAYPGDPSDPGAPQDPYNLDVDNDGVACE